MAVEAAVAAAPPRASRLLCSLWWPSLPSLLRYSLEADERARDAIAAAGLGLGSLTGTGAAAALSSAGAPEAEAAAGAAAPASGRLRDDLQVEGSCCLSGRSHTTGATATLLLCRASAVSDQHGE